MHIFSRECWKPIKKECSLHAMWQNKNTIYGPDHREYTEDILEAVKMPPKDWKINFYETLSAKLRGADSNSNFFNWLSQRNVCYFHNTWFYGMLQASDRNQNDKDVVICRPLLDTFCGDGKSTEVTELFTSYVILLSRKTSRGVKS